MIINRLTLGNFCQHKQLELEFPKAGVVILQGSNGSGKSNAVRGLQFALLGSMSDRTHKNSDLTWGEDSGYAQVEFTCDGMDGVVRRGLGTSKNTLGFGGEVFTAVKEIDGALERLLGCSLQLADKFIFIRQGNLTELPQAASAERVRLLHRLFGTDRFERVYGQLGVELNKFATVEFPTETPEGIQTQIDQHTMVLGELEYNRKNLKELIEATQELVDHHDKVRAAKLQINDPVNGLIAQQTHLDKYKKQLYESHVALDSKTAELARLTAKMAELHPRYLEANTAISQHKAATTRYARYKDLLKQADDLVKQQESIPALGEKVEPPSEEQNKQIQELSFVINSLKSTCQAFKSGKCPTCGTEHVVKDGIMQTVTGLLAESNSKLEGAQVALKNLQASYTAQSDKHRIYEAALTLRLDMVNKIASQMDRVSTSLSELGEQQEPTPQDKNLEVVVEYNACMSSSTTINNKITNLSIEVNLNRQHIESTEKSIAALLKLKGELLDDYDFDQVEKEARQQATNLVDLGSIDGRTRELNAAVKVLTANKQAVEFKLVNARKQRAYRELIVSTRDVMHRDSYPAEVAKSYLSSVNALWNEILSLLNVPFSAYLTNDLGIAVKFADGNVAAVEQLSGGQQCCLSLAFLLAVNRLFASETNLLVLDEPTYGADDEHVEAICNVLHEVQNYATSNGMQIFVVTHEEKLKRGFNNVITFGA